MGPLQMLVNVLKGLLDAGAVVFLIFISGGAFTVADRMGALCHGVN